jgi:hypothetical protein
MITAEVWVHLSASPNAGGVFAIAAATAKGILSLIRSRAIPKSFDGASGKRRAANRQAAWGAN